MVPVESLPAIVPGTPLDRAAVDLWCFYYEGETQSETLAAYDALMTAEERARHQRLRFDRDRLMFLATRALVRTVLSEYAEVRPADWRFGEDEGGKPRITGPAGSPRLSFNLTNTRGLVACAVSGGSRVGIDAERLEEWEDAAALARRCFSPLEVAAIGALPAAARRDRFFCYWTLKESYLKARGAGLALPLDQFSFSIEEGGVGVRFEAALADDARRWRFAALRSSSRHAMAVAAETGGAPLALRAARYVPLLGILPFGPRGG